ncbi:hypothetical protein CS063_11930 [Sporanaerobium hydrogeniformans]|uniref:Uncharacterized protein n=1 Tax=Sporanaerobium hydrogeniformans TaxID=3072179 RepID=A0AC61DBL7_9FIRM|nr:stalk domain-containing protein [Sporanaerobium hydrogeniformans]PHV70180.1 hypothetical protein CS063_11930 [Sporanaerobium hydrogeniformans]
MKHFSKQTAWLLAFVLLFTSFVSTSLPIYASDTPVVIGENTNEVMVAGTEVELDRWDWGNICITYYESADSDTVLYEQSYASTIGLDAIAIKPYAWHVTFVEKVQDNSGTSRPTNYYFKAYPDTSLENVPVNTDITLPVDTTLTTTGPAINISVYVGDTKLTDYHETSSSFTLLDASSLRSYVGEAQFDSALQGAGYNLPDLTKLFYTAELTDKSTSPYSLKLTLVPTVEVTFDANTGKLDSDGITRYATPKATIDSTKLPIASKDGVDFYGWKNDDQYVYLANVANVSSVTPRVSTASTLKAMYKEKKPAFQLDLTNKKVTHLLSSRTYAYPLFNWDTRNYTTVVTDVNGELPYEALSSFESYAELRLNSDDTNISLNSDYVSLRHNPPTIPVCEYTQTTARVINANDLVDCEFAIALASDSNPSSWATSSTFTGLTPETEYKIYVKHKADENGFESSPAESVAFTTLAVKTVSNDAPNGVTIQEIPVQTHTNSAIEPLPMIKDGDKTLVQGTDYTVAYTNNINVGTATATITFINSYSGTMTKNFEIAYLKHAISFDGNGGTGAMPNVSIRNGQSYTLPPCTFTPPANKVFKAWNIGGTDYAVGANYIVTAATTVQAIWMDLEKVKTPVISPNGGTFSSSQAVTLVSGTTDAIIYYTTNGTEPTAASTVYSTPFTITSSLTVKAIAVKGGMVNSDIASASFTKSSSSSGGSSSSGSSSSSSPTFTVKFNTDGGSTLDSLSIKEGATVGEIPAPTKEGYVFDGWYSDKELTRAYDVHAKITASTTLYAKWTEAKPQPIDHSKNELILTIGKKDANVFGIAKTNDFAPIVKNNRTLLPARFIAESLGAEVTWNIKKQEATIKGKNKKGEDVIILLYMDSDIAYVNGKKIKLDSPAFILNGRMLTPLRFVAEQLGAHVLWIPEDEKIVITK